MLKPRSIGRSLTLVLSPYRRLLLAAVFSLVHLSFFATSVEAIVFGTVQGGDNLNGPVNQTFAVFDATDRGAKVADSRVLVADDGKGTRGTTVSSGALTAIFEGGPFERRLRDMHAVSQQIQSSAVHYQSVGQYYLGLQPNLRFI